jgi:hypothetical protein
MPTRCKHVSRLPDGCECTVRPELLFLPRMFDRRTRSDRGWPHLALVSGAAAEPLEVVAGATGFESVAFGFGGVGDRTDRPYLL